MDCHVWGIRDSSVWGKRLGPGQRTHETASSQLGDMPISVGLRFFFWGGETTQVAGCDIATAPWNSERGWAGMLGQRVMEDV